MENKCRDYSYSYAIVRVVPRVERGECVNAGVILYSREAAFLDAIVEPDPARIRALDSMVDMDLVGRHLDAFRAICAGRPEGGPMAELPPHERFHWLTAPRSTIVQTSPVHVGLSGDPAATLRELMDTFVRTSKPVGW